MLLMDWWFAICALASQADALLQDKTMGIRVLLGFYALMKAMQG